MGCVCWVEVVLDLYEEEVEDADDCEKGKQTASISALGEVFGHLLEDVQFADTIAKGH